MVKINELTRYIDQLLQVERFKDYCPNGLQVEGKIEIHKFATGVTASMALLEAALEAEADLILVHHGYFWRGEDARVVGIKRQRLAFLLKNNINLLAYHLPLDAHPELGNNAQLGKILGITPIGFAGESNIVAYGTLEKPLPLTDFVQHIEKALQRKAIVVGPQKKTVQKVAWCTGAAQGYIHTAIELGVDIYISGEISEQTNHEALESGVSYISAGHHATERYGVQALGEHLSQKFNLSHQFIDIKNPV
ncbi:MAG: Nif3-like dinuclear metal center hexameric protein [Methylotenera sp.]|nr:Nif3-like dinuclear metal center hexameric protein [Methylotenera sp.]